MNQFPKPGVRVANLYTQHQLGIKHISDGNYPNFKYSTKNKCINDETLSLSLHAFEYEKKYCWNNGIYLIMKEGNPKMQIHHLHRN